MPQYGGAMSEVTQAVDLRHNRNFQNLWVGQFLSDLGSTMGVLAYPLLLLDLTHSTTMAGLVATLASLAAFAVRLPAGALADRVDRRRTMAVTDLARTVVLLGLGAAVVLHWAPWPLVLVVAIVDRVGDTIFTPTSTAILPTIVDHAQLERAVAANEGRQYGASLIGPALGGLLFGIARSIPFLADGVSYGISTMTSLRLRGNFRSPKVADRPGLWREALVGLRAISHDRVSRIIITQAPLINFAFNGMIISVTLALRQHGYRATDIGLAQAGIMAGGLLGAVIAPQLTGRLTLRHLIVLMTTSATALFVASALLAPTVWMALPLGGAALLAPSANAVLMGELLRRTPDELRGRVTNAMMQASQALAVLAPLVAGIALAYLDARVAVGLFAAAMAVTAVVAVLSRAGRDVARA